MGFSDFYTPPSASWSAYNQWLAEQEAAKQQRSASGSNYGGLGQAAGTLAGMYAGKKLTDKATYQALAEWLGGGGAAELGAAEIPSLGAANALTGAEAALAPSDAALASWGLGEGGAEALAGAGSNAGSMGSTIAAASPYLGAAGIGLGGLGVYNATQMADKKKAALAGGMSGAGMGMGTAMLALGAANMWNPVGWGLLGGGALLGAGLGGALAHKTTKQRQAERWSDLYDKNYTGGQQFINWQNNAQEGLDAWKSDAEAQGAGAFLLDPNQGDAFQIAIKDTPTTVTPLSTWGEVAPQALVGDDYFGKWNEQQRYDLNKRLLQEKLFGHVKGGFEILDQARAAQIAQEIGAGQYDDDWRATAAKVLDDPNTAFDESQPGFNPNDIAASGRPAAPAPIPSTSPIAQATAGATAAGTPGSTAPIAAQATAWQQAEQNMAKPNFSVDLGAAFGGISGMVRPMALGSSGSSVAKALGDALGSVAAPSKPDYAKLVSEGKYRKGSKAAGGYVNNETGEWTAG